jgi:hypothetical protein
MHFWARGYFVSTVGADEATIRAYIQKQEKEDARIDQDSLGNGVFQQVASFCQRANDRSFNQLFKLGFAHV